MPIISGLPVLTSAASADMLVVEDDSASTTKSITKTAFLSDITDGTLIASQALKPRHFDFGVVDQAARDALSLFEGLTVWREDTDAIEIYDGSAWLAFDSKWQTYTPTFYTNGTAYVLGNGIVNGKYFRTGKKCSVKVCLIMGSTTTWNGAAGSHEMSLPFNSNYNSLIDNPISLGTWSSYNSAVASTNGNVELTATVSRVRLVYYKYGNTANDRAVLTNSTPFTSAVGDAQAGQFEYEMA